MSESRIEMSSSDLKLASSIRSQFERPMTLGSKMIGRWAAATSVMTLLLIMLGGMVTTQDAGMAVPDWPGTYGYNLWRYPWITWLYGPFDLLIEHGHRLMGQVVGMLTIGLLVNAFVFDDRRWFKWSCLGILIMVCVQGVLGGVRVLQDNRIVAMIHGCTAPPLFAWMVCSVGLASSWWRWGGRASLTSSFPTTNGGGVPWVIKLLPAAAFCQLIIGAQLRHMQPWASPMVFMAFVHTHLTLAALVTTLVIWSAIVVRGKRLAGMSGIRALSGLLVLLVLVQLLLGFGTWICNYALPWADLSPELAKYTIQAKGYWESWIVTGHQAMGSLIIATASWMALKVARATHVSRIVNNA